MIPLLIVALFVIEFLLVKARPLRFALTEKAEPIKKRWGHLTVVTSAKYGVPEEIIVAVIGVESLGIPTAINKNPNGSTDYGLMQINSNGALADYEERTKQLVNPFDPAQNVEVGSWYLREIHQSFLLETWQEKIDAYNIGITAHEKGRRNFAYVNRISEYVSV